MLKINICNFKVVVPVERRLVVAPCSAVETNVSCHIDVWTRHFIYGKPFGAEQAIDVRRRDCCKELALRVGSAIFGRRSDCKRPWRSKGHEFMLVEGKFLLSPDIVIKSVDKPTRHIPAEMTAKVLRKVLSIFSAM